MNVNLEYHKGSPCVYSSAFCQEGFCCACQIYLKIPLTTTQMAKGEIVKSQKEPERVLVH